MDVVTITRNMKDSKKTGVRVDSKRDDCKCFSLKNDILHLF